MKKTWVVLAVSAVLVSVVVVLLVNRADPTGQATGSAVHPKKISPEGAMWVRLAPFEDAYLQPYAEYLRGEKEDPLELVAAINELAYNITGYGGLWRKTVPNKYFGCEINDHHEVCRRLKKAQDDFARWDELQQEMLDIGSKREARRFLKKHSEEIESYIETYVPEDESFSSVQNTPFFQKNLASAL